MTCAVDLPKLYEHIDHEELIREAVAPTYHLKFLILNMGAHRGERRCKVGETYTRAVFASRTLGAGCSHAHALIKMYTLRTLQRLEAMFPSAGIRVVVDDVSAQIFGKSANKLTATAGDFMRTFKREFEEDLKLVVNVEKTAVVAGDEETTRGMERNLSGAGLPVVATARLLGVGIATKRAAGRAVARARYAAVAVRRGEFRALFKAGGQTHALVRCDTNTARPWCSSVVGLTDGDLLRIRRDAASELCGAKRGGSVSAIFVLAQRWGPDLAYEAHFLPLRAWADSWNMSEVDSAPPRATPKHAFDKAMGKQAGSMRRWQLVRGPAGAVASTHPQTKVDCRWASKLDNGARCAGRH